jgi:two-component system, LytTR family, response regulator
MTIRVLIVDDEPVARRRLRRLLRSATDVVIAGECGDGATALDMIRELSPDVVLLDVQMPELDGFELLQTMSPEEIPVIIFVTAYDQYALRAFEVHALDYVLKPVEADRLATAISRARVRLAARTDARLDERMLALLETLAPGRKHLTRIPVRTEGRVHVLDLADVDWIGAADNYVTLHVGPREYLIRDTMGRLERELDPDRFIRVHRSSIVQIDRVRELLPDFHGDFTLVLKNGTELTLSRGYRAKLEAVLGRGL